MIVKPVAEWKLSLETEKGMRKLLVLQAKDAENEDSRGHNEAALATHRFGSRFSGEETAGRSFGTHQEGALPLNFKLSLLSPAAR